MSEVAGSPVHGRAHGAHERSHQRHDDQTKNHWRQELHRQRGIAHLPVALIRQQHKRGKRNEDPQPAANQIIHNQEHPASETRLLFILGSQHALDEFATAVAAAETPPLHGEIGEEGGHADPCTADPVETVGPPAPGHDRQQFRAAERIQLIQQ